MLCAQWVANAGDSRAVLGTRDGPRSMISVTALTEDQKPDLPKEEERILKCGGYVSHASPQFGPPRVWVRQGEGPGLAMSRSIGDHICKPVGVIATPEVLKFDVDLSSSAKDHRLLLASDGVFEFIDNKQAMDIVFAHDKASDACVALIDEAARRWREAEGNYRDDITAIVCHLPFFPEGSKPAGANADADANGGASFHLKPQSRRESFVSDEGGDTTVVASAPPAVGATPPTDLSKQPPRPAPFVQRRLTIQGDYEEGGLMAGMDELQKKYGTPAADATAAAKAVAAQ